MSISGALANACDTYSDRVAVETSSESLTYAEFWHRIVHASQSIYEAGIGRCFFATKNSIPALVALYGAIDAKAVPFLADPLWPIDERRHIIDCYGLQHAIGDIAYGFPMVSGTPSEVACPIDGVTDPNLAPALRESTAFVRFTTGSTGHPRALEFTDEAALAAARGWASASRMNGSERVLILASLHNGLSFNTSLLSVFLGGGTLLLHDGELLPSSIARTIESLKATELVAFPYVFQLLNRQVGRYGSTYRKLSRAVSSAAALPNDVAVAWHELTGKPIVNYYGIAEAGPVTYNYGSVDSVGAPFSPNEVFVGEDDGTALPTSVEGRLFVRTPSLATGYIDDGKPAIDIVQSGLLRTGDRGFLRGDGELVLTGRAVNILNVAGRKVDPSEIESLLRELDGVSDVHVRGEESDSRPFIAAYVESSVVTPTAVRQWCVERLRDYQVPQKITVLRELPRSASGKVISGAL